MKFSRTANIKRCRPCLGTYVTVTVKGNNERLLNLAVERAFQAVERVQGAMSAHDPESDLGRLSRQAPYEPMEVDPWTHEVLVLSQKLSILSRGAFDVTVGGRLEKEGFLPRFKNLPRNGGEATYADLDLLPDNRIMVQRPCRLDLGGIAKGFAVDKAVEVACQMSGVQDVIVNAGGDIRIKAERPQELWLRDPFRPGIHWFGGWFKKGSFASSGGLAAVRDFKGGQAAPLLGLGQKHPYRITPGVLVAASTCAVADALTKIVALAPPPLGCQALNVFGAKGWVASDEHGFYELSSQASNLVRGGAA
jgi:FAD:protein FMN transferase